MIRSLFYRRNLVYTCTNEKKGDFMEIILAIIGGVVLAVMINNLADTLPRYRQITLPVCETCGKRLPILHYILTKKCSNCEGSASHARRKWAIMIAFPIVSGYMWLHPPARLGFGIGVALLAFFAVLAIIDLEYRVVLNPVSVVGAMIGLAIGIWQKGVWLTLAGGAAGYGIMLGLYYFGIFFMRLISRKNNQPAEEIALGYGDVNLSGIIGLLLGWPEVVGGILIAIIAGGVTSGLIILVMVILRRYRPMMAIPYAPFLLFGASLFLYIPK